MTSGAIYCENKYKNDDENESTVYDLRQGLDRKAAKESPLKQLLANTRRTIGEPHSVAAMLPSCRNLANPKSAIFKVMCCGAGNALPQLWDSRMFCGFKSRCTMPLANSAFIAPAERSVRSVNWHNTLELSWLTYLIEWETVESYLRSVFPSRSSNQPDRRHCNTPWRDKHCFVTLYSRVERQHSHGAARWALWEF